MPDGIVFVASGSLNGLDPTVLSNNNPTYEILSPQGITVSPLNSLILDTELSKGLSELEIDTGFLTEKTNPNLRIR